MSVVGERGALSPANLLRRAEQAIATTRGACAVAAAALAVYALESVALPVIPGRDFGTYLRFYVQMWDWHSVWPMTMLFRTPVAPLVVGGSLDLLGGWGTQALMALLFAASVLAWTRVALAFGRRAALLVAASLVLYPGYGILFHELASDSITAAAFAGFALALARASAAPRVSRFALVGVAVAVVALTRPGNQALVLAAAVPLAVAARWRDRLASAAACAGAALALLGAWAVCNGIRYDDYSVARGGKAYLPFFRAFTRDHIVEPGNGPASRELARAVARHLLPKEPYRSYGITPSIFFARATDREFEDLINLSDRVWGWDSDYAILRRAGIEAVEAHPGAYARGVAGTFLEELWHPLFVKLPEQDGAAGSRAAPRRALASVAAGGGVSAARPKPLPPPADGDIIPAAHWGFYSTTPDGHIDEIWTSPTAHRVVFSTGAGQRRFVEIEAAASRLAARVPPYAGNRWLTLQLSRSSRLFPPPLAWLAAGVLGFLLRRSRGGLLAGALAGSALLLTLVNALTIYPVIEFAVPLAPALVVTGAAGLVGDPRRSR